MTFNRFAKIEPGLLRMYRLFTGVMFFPFTILFLKQLIIDGKTLRSGTTFYQALFSISFLILFIYLSIPVIRKVLGGFFLPIGLLFSIISPIIITNIGLRIQLIQGNPINPADIWTVVIILLFPLIITAWQYTYNTVLLYFVGVGMMDPLLLFTIHFKLTPEIYEAFFASLVRILALAAVGFIITELMKRQRREKNALAEANKQLKEMNLKMRDLAVSEERNRLARDLHDTLAHTLSALTVQLEAAGALLEQDNRIQLEEVIEKAARISRDGLDETRNALNDLRSTPLLKQDFHQSLKNLIEDFPWEGQKITIQNGTLPEFSPEEQQTLYRILKEALENSRKHSSATEIQVRWGIRNQEFFLEEEDNGCGFDLEEPVHGNRFGLLGLRERAEALSGYLQIKSGQGKGTQICFTRELINEKNNAG